ncbi:hypothetical protein [Thiomicrospira microaerophila]|uniref:hypothetical protein n=1 Tax=Thiomicrospira microaerophila TaxID=406020 RepID=UPI0005C81874|nr:hypothetical protein [Thiomicrospira microaerophila]
MDNLKPNLNNSSGSTTVDSANLKPDIYSGLNLLSESETKSLVQFLKETVDKMNRDNNVAPVHS